VKLRSLRFKFIWRVERDPNFPHLVNVYDIFGLRLMTFDSQRHGGTYDGNGNHWEDGDKVWNAP
jgi:hypothetical protein